MSNNNTRAALWASAAGSLGSLAALLGRISAQLPLVQRATLVACMFGVRDAAKSVSFPGLPSNSMLYAYIVAALNLQVAFV